MNLGQYTLGQGNAWIVLWKDGVFSYNLGANYPDLADAWKKSVREESEIVFVTLNPYNDDWWFMVDRNRVRLWNFKDMKEDQMDEVKRVTLGYIQRRCRRTGTMYTNAWRSGKKTV